MSAIFQAVWPITDETYTRDELIATATEQLEKLADQAHCIITGPPVWDIQPAETVIGWQAYAPGLVLICRAPAEDTRVAPLGRNDLDQSEIEVAIDRRTLPKRGADRTELVRRLREVQCLDYDEITDRTGMTRAAATKAITRVHKRQRVDQTPERTAA